MEKGTPRGVLFFALGLAGASASSLLRNIKPVRRAWFSWMKKVKIILELKNI